jgi:DNA-binding IclR family transcriptional regulator
MNSMSGDVNPELAAENAAAPGGRVQSVQRATTLLAAVADASEPLTAPELAERCGLNRSTAWRILGTLEDAGFVERDPATNRYSVGYAITRLAAAGGDASLVRLARPLLLALAAETQETASLALPRQAQLVYVDQVQATRVMAPDWLARSVPLHATSTGRALLAWLPKEEREAVLARPLARFTPMTVTDPDELRTELERIRAQGYAVSRGELEPALWGASAAVLDGRPQPIAVVSVWGLEDRVRDRLDELGAAAARTAAQVRAAVMGRPRSPDPRG